MMNPQRRTRSDLIVLCFTLLLLVLPPVVDLGVSGFRRVFDYLMSDAYYYLVVARNIADHGSVSFDGQFATNGFHPAWQFILAAVFGIGRLLHLGQPAVIYLSLATSLGLIAAGLYLLGRGIAAQMGRLSALFVTMPVGAYGLLVLPSWTKEKTLAGLPPVLGTLWSYVNGMESGTAIFFFCALSWWFLTRPAMERSRDTIVLGFLSALLMLSRLDHLFIPGFLLGLLFAQALWSRERARIRRNLIAIACFAAPILFYCAINWIWFGSPMPSSGAIKTTFPHLHKPNLERLVACLFHFREQSIFRLYRMWQIFIPMVAALMCLAVELRPGFMRVERRVELNPLRVWLVAVALGVFAVSSYDLFFVDLAAQGPWYTPIGTLFTSLYPVILLGRAFRGLEQKALTRGIMLAAGLSLGGLFFVRYERSVGSGAGWANFYLDEAPRVKAFYSGKSPMFLEIDDGIFSFSTGFPAMPNFCFVGDPACMRETKKGLLIPLAVSRGYNRITSVFYVGLGLDMNSASDVLCGRLLEPSARAICPKYHFQMEYVHGNFGVIRVDPK